MLERRERMPQQEEEATTPLQSVRDCSRRLRQEWEGMMQNADVISSEMLSALKDQESALMVEQKEVQLLKHETQNLRIFLSRTTQEQEKKATAERKLAYEVKGNILNQVEEVKQLQCHLTNQLAKMRHLIERIKSSRQQESADSLLPCSAMSELCYSKSQQAVEQLDLKIVLPLDDKDPGLSSLPSGSPADHPHRLIADACSKSFRLKDTKATPLCHKVFEQNVSRPKVEVFRSDGYSHCKEGAGSKVKSRDNLLLACGSGLDRFEIDRIRVKTECDEEAEGPLKKGCSQKLLCNAASGALPAESDTDGLDEVLLSERLEILVQELLDRRCTEEEDWGIPSVEVLEKKKLLDLGRNSVATKRKWEVPIEIALQEDAPGLLEKLQERGLLEDMTIYGSFCEDDWGNSDEQFKDLECIARKIWGAPSGLIKMPVIRQHASGLGKGPMYCLACLVSLIEQAKALRQRNWPVEWGWCRELQAFIFVFDKHNRVVLERPEYGNATYFFELVQFLPAKWQVLRLIHVLSVAALGKTYLLENRPLEVGYELTADESKILEGFGWAAGTGLGTFLNFCDRVCHDVKDDDNLEWRQKIGKCLMDGHDKGRIMTHNLPPKFLKGSNAVKFEADVKPGTVLSS